MWGPNPETVFACYRSCSARGISPVQTRRCERETELGTEHWHYHFRPVALLSRSTQEIPARRPRSTNRREGVRYRHRRPSMSARTEPHQSDHRGIDQPTLPIISRSVVDPSRRKVRRQPHRPLTPSHSEPVPDHRWGQAQQGTRQGPDPTRRDVARYSQ